MDGERACRRRQVAAVATPVDERLVDRDLAVEVIDIVIRLRALCEDHALAGAGRRTTHAVDMRSIGIRAADHAHEQLVSSFARLLAAFRQVLQTEKDTLAGTTTHVGGGNADLR